MKRGFTLLELIIVVIILGVLATLGLTQYGRAIERSRGAEGRAVLGTIRTYAAAFYMQENNITTVTAAGLLMGTGLDQIPTACRTSHYFVYTFATAGTTITTTATRCTALGKNPNFTAANTLTLASDLSAGVDTWGGTGGY